MRVNWLDMISNVSPDLRNIEATLLTGCCSLGSECVRINKQHKVDKGENEKPWQIEDQTSPDVGTHQHVIPSGPHVLKYLLTVTMSYYLRMVYMYGNVFVFTKFICMGWGGVCPGGVCLWGCLLGGVCLGVI